MLLHGSMLNWRLAVWRGRFPKPLHKAVSGWQGRNQPGLWPALSKDLWFQENGICLSVGLYLLRLLFPGQLPAVSAKAKGLYLQSSWADVVRVSSQRHPIIRGDHRLSESRGELGCSQGIPTHSFLPRQVNSQEEAEERLQSECILP